MDNQQHPTSWWDESTVLITLIGFCTQRHQLKQSTPITGELFANWKKKKSDEKEAELAAKRAERAKMDRMRYRLLHVVWYKCLGYFFRIFWFELTLLLDFNILFVAAFGYSGRELFAADASLFVDDAEAFDKYQREDEEQESSRPSDRPAEVL